VSPDDRRFVLIREGEATQQSEMVVAQHWLPEVTAKTAK
jgi:hypothetical protein